jgi:hypothetical protein
MRSTEKSSDLIGNETSELSASGVTIIKTKKKLLKQLKHEKLINIIIKAFSNTLFEKVRQFG